jgi:WD40 repeat protein
MIPLRGHGAGVLSVVFSPDGMQIASASQDMTVKVWNAARPSPSVLRARREAALDEVRSGNAKVLNEAEALIEPHRATEQP